MRILSLLFALLLASCATTKSTKSGGRASDEGVSPSEKTTPSERRESKGTAEFEPFDEPVPVQEEEVTFESGDATLKGVVLRPEGLETAHPAVVIVHDFGPMGRDGTVDELFGVRLPVAVPVYRALGESLAERGFVVLLYDKRSCVQGVGAECSYPRSYIDDHPNLGMALVQDATAAAAYLLGRTETSDVSFIGHGHGAEIAAAAAGSGAEVQQIVMLAPSAYTADEVIRFQTERSIELLGGRIAEVGDTSEADLLKQQKSAAEAMLAKQREQFAKLDQLEDADAVFGLPVQTWRGFREVHANYRDMLTSGSVPAFAVLPAVDPGLPDDNAAHMIELLGSDAGTHESFDELTRAMVAIADSADPTIIDPRVVELLVEIL